MLNMNTGILTFHHAHHYGAQLQAFALMKAIMDQGVDCEIINYVRKDTIEGSSLFKRKPSVRSLLSNVDTLLNYAKLKKRYDRFEGFINDEMKLSEKFYPTYDALRADAPKYDAYVCGSDQIWNPLIFEDKTFDPAFFADFAKSGRRIAYAPSFGISSIPENRRELLKKYLEKFDCLSARERQGEKIIRELTGRDASTVLDPTLLLTGEAWNAYSSAPIFTEPYILCYFITSGVKYKDFVQAIQEKYKLPVVSLCGSRRTVPQTRHSVLDAGPKGFLRLFADASVICTDSFHGTVFSINFEKEFFCFKSIEDAKARDKGLAAVKMGNTERTERTETRKRAETTVNSRLHNILERLGLLSRLFSHTMDPQEFRNRIEEDAALIDYDSAHTTLRREREKSIRYLRDSLQLGQKP